MRRIYLWLLRAWLLSPLPLPNCVLRWALQRFMPPTVLIITIPKETSHAANRN